MDDEPNRVGCHADCIETYSGKMLSLCDPQPSDILIVDIAESLSKLCRFAGHCRGHYSVAQHSVVVHGLAVERYGERGDMTFAAIMHDAHEAYTHDLTRPAKLQVGDYHAFEDRMAKAVREKFGVAWSPATAFAVKQLDNIACRAEAHALMLSRGKHWDWGDCPLMPLDIKPWGRSDAFDKDAVCEYPAGLDKRSAVIAWAPNQDAVQKAISIVEATSP